MLPIVGGGGGGGGAFGCRFLGAHTDCSRRSTEWVAVRTFKQMGRRC